MQNWHRLQCIRAALSGGVIAYPTEAVYGLGCLPANQQAVRRIVSLKRRSPRKKGLIIVASTIEQILPFIELAGLNNSERIFNSWPGAITWIFPANRKASKWLIGEKNTVAVRVSAHAVVRSLCDALGPLISTSANPADAPPARSAMQVRNYFATRVDYIYPARLPQQGLPTEIRNAVDGQIMRKGGA